MFTKEDLQRIVQREIGDYPLVIVSNRQPYIHQLVEGNLEYIVPAGGLTSALDPLMQACGGTWLAQGGGTGDCLVVGAGNKVMVPPDNPTYALRLV